MTHIQFLELLLIYSLVYTNHRCGFLYRDLLLWLWLGLGLWLGLVLLSPLKQFLLYGPWCLTLGGVFLWELGNYFFAASLKFGSSFGQRHRVILVFWRNMRELRQTIIDVDIGWLVGMLCSHLLHYLLVGWGGLAIFLVIRVPWISFLFHDYIPLFLGYFLGSQLHFTRFLLLQFGLRNLLLLFLSCLLHYIGFSFILELLQFLLLVLLPSLRFLCMSHGCLFCRLETHLSLIIACGLTIIIALAHLKWSSWWARRWLGPWSE